MVKIISDSTCDLSPEIIKELDITLTPLYIISGDEQFRDGVDIQPVDVFRMVDKEKKSLSTAAVNIFEYETVFEQYSASHDEVVHINISQGFSACYQNAIIAAEEFPNVHVVDSRNLSTGSGYLVHDAAIMAKEGKTAKEICDYLEEAKTRMNASFVIDRLDYLHKGGRCSLAKLIATRVLNIKPCIEVADGKMRVGAKFKGKFDNCLDEYVKARLSNIDNIDLKRVYITHTTCTTETVERIRGALAEKGFKDIIETNAGCTVSNHCGPFTLGVLFMQKTPLV
ncbi:MAG: DegV family protein [Oscillospiraceae bacterium]|nr:DegV family protein [Oscillospiraceae bacterium]